MSRLRLCYVVPRYAPALGGVETHTAHLARRMAALGHQVEVFTQTRDRRLPCTEMLDGVLVRRFIDVAPNHAYALAPGLWRALRRDAARFAIVHAHSYHALPSLAAAFSAPRALIFTPHYHGTGHSPLRRLLHIPYRPLGATIIRRATRIICVSAAEAALLRRHFPFAAGKLLVIPNGIEVAAIGAAEPFAAAGPILLSVGRLEAYKQVDLLIQAMTHLGPDVRLAIIGEGPVRPALARRAAQLQLQDRVAFLGRVSDHDLHRWYRTAAVYVTCSQHEAFGMTLWEALSGGAAVVASRIPAFAEVAREQGEQVRLVPVTASARTLATAIESMLTARGGAPARPALSWDEVAARTLNLYREVAGAGV